MITYRKAVQLLKPGDVVFSLDELGGVAPVTVLEVCDGWLETDIGILDFDDHGYTWWLTQKVAMENVRR
jgi:hypothetical protein